MSARLRDVVLLALGVTCAVVRTGFAADVQSKLDQLNEREKQLIQKLEAAQQRVRDIESRLEEVRHRKQYVLNQQAQRTAGKRDTAPAASPVPTP